MDPLKRYEMIRPIIAGEKTVSEVQQESGVSSRTIYRYLLRFQQGNENLESLRDKSHAIHSHPKWLTDDEKAKVISYQLQNPSKSTRQIALDLKTQGILEISYRTVGNILNGNFANNQNPPLLKGLSVFSLKWTFFRAR